MLIGLLAATMPLTPMPTQAAGLEQPSVTHTVARDETMFSIALRYDTSVEAVRVTNGIANPALLYVGQQLTIPTADSTTNAPSSPDTEGDTHVVGPGENLYRIALRYGITVQALAQLNGITNHHHIVVGQRLRISGVSATSTTTLTTTLQVAQANTTHTVGPGETLATIALRYGTTIWALAQANAIANPSLIFPGQVLTVQATSSTTPATASTGFGGEKRIVVDLSEQHLYAYQGGTLIYSFVASSGVPSSPTRTGTFSVLNKMPNAYASTWNLQMPYWMGIYWSSGLQNGIHALPILSNGQLLWAGYLGAPVSYGCIVLGTYEASLLYEWAGVGTVVVVQP